MPVLFFLIIPLIIWGIANAKPVETPIDNQVSPTGNLSPIPSETPALPMNLSYSTPSAQTMSPTVSPTAAPSPTQTTTQNSGNQWLGVTKTSLINFLSNTEKNIFFHQYDESCDKGDSDHSSTFFCDNNDKLVYVSYTSEDPKLTDNPLSYSDRLRRIKGVLGFLNTKDSVVKWAETNAGKLGDGDEVEITDGAYRYTLNKSLDSYDIQISLVAENTEKLSGKIIDYPEYYHLGEYDTNGRKWQAIHIPPELNEAEVIAFAKKIHAANPSVEYKIFSDDDKQEYEKYALWDSEYPNHTLDEWGKEKYVGSIQKYPDSNNKLKYTLVFSEFWGGGTHEL